MTTRSAVARVARSASLGAIHQRLHAFLGGLPSGSRSLLSDSLLPAGADSPEPTSICRNDFYWLLIPEWLAVGEHEGLSDILWAQYCLYCLLRCQDDVVDGDSRKLHLTVAANLLVVEAASTLRQVVRPTSPFWPWHDEALAATSCALIELDARQSSPARDGHGDLALYARLSRCLTLATRAIHLDRGAEDWSRWSTLLDHLAVAGQILDDFHDLETDLRRGKYNFAAWFLTRPVLASTVEAVEAIIASNVATTDRLHGLFGCVHAQLDAAAALLHPGDDSRIHAYVARFQRTTHQLEKAIGFRQHRLLVAPPTPSVAPAPSYTATTF